jgi:DNA-binding FadR family transcriptional regulator
VFKPVEASRVSEGICEQIEHAILTGKLSTGDRLPSERSLMEQFRASRGSIREALRVLESRGLIQIRHGDPAGPLVVGSFGKAITHYFGALARADRLALDDVIEFRMLIEGAAAYLAAGQTKARLRPLVDAFKQMEASADPDQLHQADLLFHRREVEVSGNPILVVLEDALHQHLGTLAVSRGLAELPFAEASRLTLAGHGLVLDAILAGNGDLAALRSRTNLQLAYARLLPAEGRKRLRAMLDMTRGSELGPLPKV